MPEDTDLSLVRLHLTSSWFTPVETYTERCKSTEAAVGYTTVPMAEKQLRKMLLAGPVWDAKVLGTVSCQGSWTPMESWALIWQTAELGQEAPLLLPDLPQGGLFLWE